MTVSALPPADALPPGIRGLLRQCFPSLSALFLAILTCIIVPASLIVVHVAENPMLSPIDEAAHFDYVDRMAEGNVPRLGDLLLPSTLRTISCTGSALYGIVSPPCDARTLLPSEYAGGGYQYEAQQPPTYYAVTLVLRWVPQNVLGIDSLDATRLVGIVWLATGLLLVWGAGRLLELRPKTISIGMLLLATAPVILYESSIVSNSATAVLSGGLVTFLAALAWRRRERWALWALAGAGFLVCSMDASNFLPVGVVSVLFVILAFADQPPGQRPPDSAFRRVVNSHWSRHAMALVLGGGLSIVLWLIAFHARALIDPRTLPTFNVLRTGRLGPSLAIGEGTTLLAPLTNSYAAYRSAATALPPESTLSQELQLVMSTVLQFAVLAGALAWLFVRPRLWSHWLGIVALPALYVGGVVLGVSVYLTYHADPGLSGRYGLSVAPLLVLGLIGSLQGRVARVLLGAFAVVSVGMSFYFMLAS